MSNPEIIAEVTRGGITESKHRLSAVIIRSNGEIVESWGDITTPVYPRSAIKALQALAFVERGGAETFGFSEQELALCCASHNGEPEHVNAAQSMLDKISKSESDYECGLQWPMRVEAGYELAHAHSKPDQRHNNCSGKHAGMLGLAAILGVDAQGYIKPEHPVQQTIVQTMSEICDIDMTTAPASPDGCSAPTWAIPLRNLALGFARFGDPENLSLQRAQACRKLYQACVTNPFMVAGTKRYCSGMMELLGKRVFLKVGAEGVYVAAIPELKLAIALKCEDGASRSAEVVMTALLEHLGVTQDIEESKLAPFRAPEIRNWNGLLTGHVRCELA